MNLNQLQPYIPKNSLIFVENWIKNYNLIIKITKSRITKLGDYRKLSSKNHHQITINGNLNKDAFFFVLTHEIAHMMVYQNNSKKLIRPHGKEWKNIFSHLLQTSINVYEKDLQKYIINHSKSPKASVGADIDIAKFVINDKRNIEFYLDDIKIGDKFNLNNRWFIKGNLLKKRYLCLDISNNKQYLINATTIVNI